MSNKPVPLTRADLLAAAWKRYEAARAANRARAALREAAKPFEAARNAYQQASAEAEKAARGYELMEQRMLLQETADAEGVAA